MPMLMPMIIIGLAAVHRAAQRQPRARGGGNPSALPRVGWLLARLRLGCQGTRATWLTYITLGSWAILLNTVS